MHRMNECFHFSVLPCVPVHAAMLPAPCFVRLQEASSATPGTITGTAGSVPMREHSCSWTRSRPFNDRTKRGLTPPHSSVVMHVFRSKKTHTHSMKVEL
jgi:hypothetical protein